MGVNVLVYANSDHMGDVVDRKGKSEICTFVGSCLTSWFLKKQTSLANSITKSDYVAAERACQQALWIKQAFMDYNITLNEVPTLCDDKCDINLTSSLVDYPRTKHIEITHHFLKDNVVKKHITINKIHLGENLENILTKPLEKDQFNYLRLGLGLMLQEEEEEKNGQDVIEEKISNSEESMNKGEMEESSKKLKRKFKTIKGYEGDERMLLDIISKMNRKLEDEKIKRNDKGNKKVNDC
ncbi:hypothetical protein Tco_1115209 [Tanacetum coccineum]